MDLLIIWEIKLYFTVKETRAKVAQYFVFFNKVCRQSSICLKYQLTLLWHHISERSKDNKESVTTKVFVVNQVFIGNHVFA